MKNKTLALILVGLLVLLGAVLVGCGGGTDSDLPDNQETENPEDEGLLDEDEDQGGQSGGNSGGSGDILALSAKVGKIKSFHYESVYTFSDGEEFVIEMWIKDQKFRSEMIDSDSEELMVSLIDAVSGDMYIYYPDSNYAMKMDVDYDVLEGNMTLENFYDSAEMDEFVFVKKEVFDGKKCDVYEGIDFEGYSATMWIWEEWGIPVKIVSEVGDEVMTVVFKNIEFNKVKDSVFDLPAGVELLDFSGAMG